MTTDTAPTKTWTHYTPEQIDNALTTLALIGSSNRAAAELGMPAETLRVWRRATHADRYQAIRAELLPKIREKIAQDAEDLAIRYAEAEHQALDQFGEHSIQRLSAAELANALPRLATARGISTDKANVMRDRPTSITETRSITEVEQSIAKKLGTEYIDSTAEEIDEAGQLTARSLPRHATQTRVSRW